MVDPERFNVPEPHHESNQAAMLWLFIGAILIIYGIIIFSTGLIHYLAHAPFHTVLENKQPDIIWGLVLFFAGLLFTLFNWRQVKKNKK